MTSSPHGTDAGLADMAKFFLTFRLQFLTIFYTVQLCLAKPVLKKIAFTAENNMEQAVIDESRLKEIMKKALIEVFEERKNLFYEMVAEVLECCLCAISTQKRNL